MQVLSVNIQYYCTKINVAINHNSISGLTDILQEIHETAFCKIMTDMHFYK